jgi:hypothetical protein
MWLEYCICSLGGVKKVLRAVQAVLRALEAVILDS